MKRVIAVAGYEGRPTTDGRVIHRIEVPLQVASGPIPVVDGRPGMGREVIGQAWPRLENHEDLSRWVVAECEIYDDAAAALLAPESPLRLVVDMVGEVEAVDEEECRIRVFTEPETRPGPVHYRFTGEVRGLTLTPVPAWDDLWVKEARDVG